VTLPEQDKKFLEKLKTQLVLTDEQYKSIQSVYEKNQVALNTCDEKIKEYEKTLTNEDELQLKVKVLNQQKKDIRDMRELDVRLLLTAEQLKIYDEQIKPNKPTVLHFGIHDRANCSVCK
jgi:uncharacterized protein YjaZ